MARELQFLTEVLKEKFVDAKHTTILWGNKLYAELFVNPTVSELKADRGVIDPKGNLYVMTSVDREGAEEIIYIDILRYLQSKKLIK